MSTSSLVPSGIPSDFKPKSFWQRPEGKPGIVLLLAGAGALAFYGWGTIVPFVLNTIADTFWLAIYTGGLLALADVVFGLEPIGRNFKNIFKNVFMSISRLVARTYTEIDPIGILRNNLQDMEQEKVNLDGTVGRFSGSEEQLKRKISEKTTLAQQVYAKSQVSTQKATSATDPLEKQKYTLASQTYAEQAGLLLQGVNQLKALEVDTAHLLTTFQTWSQLADAKIQRTKFKVDFLAEQRDVILSAKSTLSFGQRLLKGKPEQEQMVDMAIEYLEQDTAQTLGQIREFSRYTDKLSTDQDIESGANAELARQQFAEFSQKLLTSGSSPSAADLIQIPGVANTAPVPVSRSSSSTDFNLFQ